ncbi:MAG: aromatic-ring-hydroxylating dioxygenase subunit beta [Steroidobacteraceae bacterium]
MDKWAVLNLVNDLQQKYIFAIDRKDMNGWLACFAEDGTYLCQTRENYDEKLPIGFMWDDRYGRLKDRVKTVNEVWAGTAEDYQSRHLIQSVDCKDAGNGLYDVVTNIVVFYTTNRGDSRVLATGEYLDRVRITGDRAQFVSKKAILDQTTVPRYLVYPV